MTRRLQIPSPTGASLDVEVSGPEGGEAVIFHPGTPSAGTVFPPMAVAGAERGLCHVSYARPGYGDSERNAGRTVADCVEDVAAIADELGHERFYTVGWSGGGPHALACAALLPERTIAAATLASIAPFEAEGLDWLAGMGPENLDEFAATERGEEALLRYLKLEVEGLRTVTPEQLLEAFGGLLSEVDQSSLSGEFAGYMADSCRGAVRNGPFGWLDDDLAFVRDWGFALDSIRCPVTIWQGGEDRFVPFAHGEWLSEAVSGATARLLPEEGHLSIVVGRYGQVLDELIRGRA